MSTEYLQGIDFSELTIKEATELANLGVEFIVSAGIITVNYDNFIEIVA